MQLFTKNGLYLPPAAGEADHADPHFKPRLRDCGRCSNPFETTPRWRYFCPKMQSQSGCEEYSIAYLFDVSKEDDRAAANKAKQACVSYPVRGILL